MKRIITSLLVAIVLLSCSKQINPPRVIINKSIEDGLINVEYREGDKELASDGMTEQEFHELFNTN